MKPNVTIIAVALIAVVAIAGAAVFMLNNGGGSGDDDILEKTELPVYGNANGDKVVNGQDIELIKKIMDGTLSLDDYPFADANNDGVVDASDITVVNKLISGEQTTVFFIDQYDLVAGKYRVVSLDYPLRDIVTQNADMLLMTMMIDSDDQVAGYVANIDNYKNQFYKVLHNGVSKQLGSTARYIAASDWKAIKDLDVELQSKNSKIGAILVHSDSALGDYKDDILASGIPLVYLRCTDPIYSIDASLLLGFLLGPDYSPKAVSFVNDCAQTIKDVSSKVSKISDSDKKRFIALSMKIYVAESESQYTKIGMQAGGKEMSGLKGNSSTKLQDTEAITKYNDKIDTMLNCSTQDCTVVTPDELWELSDMRFLEKSTHYQDMVWINMSMPVPCRVMYAAYIFYPDIVSKADADSYFQMMVDEYMSYLDYTVEDGDFDVTKDMFTICTYQDYLDYKGGETPGEKVISEISSKLVAEHFYNNMDLTGYSGVPYTVTGDDQEANVFPESGKYYVTVKLYNDAKAKFETTKVAYLEKIGKSSAMGGEYIEIDVPTGLTDGIGYYVNTTNSDSIGSMYYAGYIKECYIEAHLAKKPSLSESDLKNIVDALWGVDGTVSAKESAKRFDLSKLSAMDYPPYSVTSESTDMLAEISCSKNDAGKHYYITYNNSSDALIKFLSEKQEYIDKIGTDYMGGIATAIEKGDFEDGYGFYGQAVRQGGFWMMKFVGVKEGCYVTAYLRSNTAYDDQTMSELVNAMAASIA